MDDGHRIQPYPSCGYVSYTHHFYTLPSTFIKGDEGKREEMKHGYRIQPYPSCGNVFCDIVSVTSFPVLCPCSMSLSYVCSMSLLYVCYMSLLYVPVICPCFMSLFYVPVICPYSMSFLCSIQWHCVRYIVLWWCIVSSSAVYPLSISLTLPLLLHWVSLGNDSSSYISYIDHQWY
jgi:hypothetical protein